MKPGLVIATDTPGQLSNGTGSCVMRGRGIYTWAIPGIHTNAISREVARVCTNDFIVAGFENG